MVFKVVERGHWGTEGNTEEDEGWDTEANSGQNSEEGIGENTEENHPGEGSKTYSRLPI
jgi:hypothetical protein